MEWRFFRSTGYRLLRQAEDGVAFVQKATQEIELHVWAPCRVVHWTYGPGLIRYQHRNRSSLTSNHDVPRVMATMGGARMLNTVRCHGRSPRIAFDTPTLRSCFSKGNRSSTCNVNSGMGAFSSPWIPMGNGFRWGIKRQSIAWYHC